MWNVRKEQELHFLPRIITSENENGKEVNVVGVASKMNSLKSILDILQSEMIAKRKGKCISARKGSEC